MQGGCVYKVCVCVSQQIISSISCSVFLLFFCFFFPQELEGSRREAEEMREREEHREREVEELVEKEAEERHARRAAEDELERLRVSHRCF